MTAHDEPRPRAKRPEKVTDPQWEDALRAGQAEDGGAGSVEAELGVLHLLRHAATPEELGDEALEAVWSDIAAEITPTPWWRRTWVWWGGTAVAAAAAAVLVIVIPSDPVGDVSRSDDPVQTAAAESPAETLERQFALLAPAARDELERTVEDSRGAMRRELLAMAASADGKTAGGAP
jgi:hypothetical protein